MKRYLLDSSCLVAVLCTWHEHHEATRREIEKRAARGEKAAQAAPCLVEAFAVLTRLPPPRRLSPDDALDLLEANWSSTAVVALSAADHWRVLRDCRMKGISGGQTYDAIIAACARKARVDTLLTWNLTHFLRLQPDFEVRAPGDR